MPLDRVLNWPRLASCGRGRLERVARAAALAEGFGEDLGHHAPGFAMDTSEPDGQPNEARVYPAGLLHVRQPQVPRCPDDGPAKRQGRRSGSRTDPLLDSAPDMGPLAAVERFLERLFERQSARLFRTAIQPIQVQRRLERSMEADRVRDGGRTARPASVRHPPPPDDLAGAAGVRTPDRSPRRSPTRPWPSPGAMATPCSIDRPSRCGRRSRRSTPRRHRRGRRAPDADGAAGRIASAWRRGRAGDRDDGSRASRRRAGGGPGRRPARSRSTGPRSS